MITESIVVYTEAIDTDFSKEQTKANFETMTVLEKDMYHCSLAQPHAEIKARALHINSSIDLYPLPLLFLFLNFYLYCTLFHVYKCFAYMYAHAPNA